MIRIPCFAADSNLIERHLKFTFKQYEIIVHNVAQCYVISCIAD